MINIIKNRFVNMEGKSKNVVKNIFGALIIRGLSLFLVFFTTPAYIAFFNNQSILGIWFTIISVFSWILTFDLGIGNGLRNKLTLSLAKHNYYKAKSYVTSAYIVIGIISVIGIFFVTTFFDIFNWNMILGIENTIISLRTLSKTIKIVFIGIILQFFFKIISSILYALQKSSINNLISLFTNIIIFLFVSFGKNIQSIDEKLILLAFVYLIAVNLPLIIISIVVFVRHKEIRLNISTCKKSSIRDVMGLGGLFFFIQIVFMLLMNTNEILITRLCGSKYVVEYQIYFKLFSLFGTLFTLMLTPIWSAVTKACAEKDIKWIKRIYKFLIKSAMICCLVEFIMVPFVQPIVNIWLREEAIKMDLYKCLFFAILGSEIVLNGVQTSVANGLSLLKEQLIGYSLALIIKIVLSILFVNMFGWVTIVVSTNLSLIPFFILQTITLKKHLVRNTKEN